MFSQKNRNDELAMERNVAILSGLKRAMECFKVTKQIGLSESVPVQIHNVAQCFYRIRGGKDMPKRF